MKTTSKTLEKGFYYHYKHDPKGEINNYAYEVLGVAKDSEKDEMFIAYRPLYKDPYFDGVDLLLRPSDMFLEEVTKDNKTFPRFKKITDSKIINQLEKTRASMYRE